MTDVSKLFQDKFDDLQRVKIYPFAELLHACYCGTPQ